LVAVGLKFHQTTTNHLGNEQPRKIFYKESQFYEIGLEERGLKRFSERKGLKKARTEIQVNSMDEALRNRLWNVLDYYYWRRCSLEYDEITGEMGSFLNKLWHNYFKEPVDTISDYGSWEEALENIRERYFELQWFEVYDFLEFVADNFPDEDANQRFTKTCNDVLEKELSAYRFVGGLITQVTSETEISTIEESLESPLKTVNAHLENALRLMSDRKSPDYRNSIKESISAVEAICRVIAQDDKATLGKALDKIEKKIGKVTCITILPINNDRTI
jgi:hypothetical protein